MTCKGNCIIRITEYDLSKLERTHTEPLGLDPPLPTDADVLAEAQKIFRNKRDVENCCKECYCIQVKEYDDEKDKNDPAKGKLKVRCTGWYDLYDTILVTKGKNVFSCGVKVPTRTCEYLGLCVDSRPNPSPSNPPPPPTRDKSRELYDSIPDWYKDWIFRKSFYDW
jgi:hypothetical protein